MPCHPPIDTSGPLVVLGPRYEIMFKDGSSIGLHQVWHNGAPVLLLRALRQGSMFVVFDLSKIVPSLGADLPPCPTRDVVRLVYYTLRSKFKTANACIEAIVANQKAIVPAGQAQDHVPEELAA